MSEYTNQNERMMPRDANEIYRQMLERKLEAAITDAMPLVLAGDLDGAEQKIRTVDCDIYGWLAMARMYIAAISSLGGTNADAEDRDRILIMFNRAVAHREQAYPMTHTQDEADAYDRGRAEDRGQVVQEVGFDPSMWPFDSN